MKREKNINNVWLLITFSGWNGIDFSPHTGKILFMINMIERQWQKIKRNLQGSLSAAQTLQYALIILAEVFMCFTKHSRFSFKHTCFQLYNHFNVPMCI